MAEELGKIEKPPVENFKSGRKLFFIPLIFSGKDLPQEFQEKFKLYWDQVDSQIVSLEVKLGPVNRVYHELIPESGEQGVLELSKLEAAACASCEAG